MTAQMDDYYVKIIKYFVDEAFPKDLTPDQKSEFRKAIKNYERGESESDILYFWQNGIRLKVCLDRQERRDAIVKAHINEGGRHLNASQTMYRLYIELKRHWNTIENDTDVFIKNACAKCMTDPPSLEENCIVDEKNKSKTLVIEILGPLTLTKRGSRFVGILIDVDTRWINALPLQTYDVIKLATLLNESFSQFSGSEIYFIGVEMDFARQVDENLKSVTSEPSSNPHLNEALENSKTECYVKGVLSRQVTSTNNVECVLGLSFDNVLNRYIPAIHKHVYQHPQNWDQSLQGLACDLRKHVWEDRGYSAYYAFFLEKPRLDIQMGEVDFSLSDEDSETGDAKSWGLPVSCSTSLL